MISKQLYSLQVKTKQNFEENLEHLRNLIIECEGDSIILAPEVCLTNFCYQKMDEASAFAKEATKTLLTLSSDRTIITTMIEKYRNGFYNNLKVFHKGELLHKQSKHKLFPLGNEHLHFQSGDIAEISHFKIDDLVCGALNCFELRFIELWERVKGCDLIFVPAQWGKERKDNFETLTKALAITTQSFVLASSGANDTCAKGSGIITPFGVAITDDSKEIIGAKADFNAITQVRKYINIGLS
ncbi:carbon-nitrogen hydrolase family protein [Helicobacter turcicus]|uniref:Carbon-nitrogen hydrolase family protein n=1 Tax=Helicobacter turcicus TaxID=2867412 RepID=A0ABS7JMC2_9HELI|nr:carbon-nitrogen hydrolase family protein [Helicobacter turcicus]MBX7490534.1 carbon-nitrogen hydrolase family protein [Helicobacter turcicus]MBX7545393.1 carbon-nitrogen hydrolase family protein [Helicobacter turcicus]